MCLRSEWLRRWVWSWLLLVGAVFGAGPDDLWGQFELLQDRQKEILERIPGLEFRYLFAVDRVLADGTQEAVRTWEGKNSFAFGSPPGHFLGLIRWDVEQWLLAEDGTKTEVRLQFARNLERACQRSEQTDQVPQFTTVGLSERETGERMFLGSLPWDWCDPYAGIGTYERGGGLELVSISRIEEAGDSCFVVVFRHRQDEEESVATLVFSEAQGCLPIRAVRKWHQGNESVWEVENKRFALGDGGFFLPMRVVSRYKENGRLVSTMTYEVVPDSVRVHEEPPDPASPMFTLQDRPDEVLIIGEIGRPVREPNVEGKD
jgi:hypothetical protein